ncbi:MAG: gamma-glutamyl-gamma-aminobutyrate hydrolase family protein [Inquilinaceae bacterium]
MSNPSPPAAPLAAPPLIAILLDENTSGDGSRYEAGKAYFRAVARAGGAAFGVPYDDAALDRAAASCDGLLTTGSRFAFPHRWYRNGAASRAPASDRLTAEVRILESFLARDKPVLGICGGMQTLAGLAGCTLVPDTADLGAGIGEHCGDGVRHTVDIADGTRLRALTGTAAFPVNSHHWEAVADAPDTVTVSARAGDGVIEAIELPDHRFALGIQWHQERHEDDPDHPGHGILAGFVAACAAGRK